MKKIILLVVLISLCQGVSLFAQESKYKESDYYYFNVPIEKIYTHRLGYVVLYRKGAHQMARTYLPLEWFTDAAGKGEVYGLNSGKDWPSMTVYYKNGEFSHVRLRIRRDRMHETWGMIPLNVNIDEYFQGIEEVKIEH
jgi:hypothetical protein